MFTLLILMAVIVVVIWFVVVYTAQRYVIWPGQFRPQAHAAPLPDKLLAEVLTKPLDENDPSQGEIQALFLPGEGVHEQSPGPLVIFAHGNGELIQDWASEMWPYRRMGVSVLLPEYRGYGRSAGSPDIREIVLDFAYWYDQMVQRADVDASKVIFHGRSIGGGVIGELSGQRKPAAVVLESTFTSINRMARKFLVPSFLVHQRMDVNGTISALDVPVFIAHGDADRIIAMYHAKDNHAAIPGSVLQIYPRLGHNDPLPSLFHKQLQQWLEQSGIIDSSNPRGITP